MCVSPSEDSWTPRTVLCVWSLRDLRLHWNRRRVRWRCTWVYSSRYSDSGSWWLLTCQKRNFRCLYKDTRLQNISDGHVLLDYESRYLSLKRISFVFLWVNKTNFPSLKMCVLELSMDPQTRSNTDICISKVLQGVVVMWQRLSKPYRGECIWLHSDEAMNRQVIILSGLVCLCVTRCGPSRLTHCDNGKVNSIRL